MNRFYFSQIVILFSSVCNCALAQNCIDYGEFDEPPCLCTPPGWDSVLGSEEFDDVTAYGPCYSLSEESPSGGTAVALDITGPGFSEGIYTTVDGLTPNIEYTLMFWWASITLDCGGGVLICCADLSVEVDGQITTFPSTEDWTLAEICITPETSSIEIELLGIHNGIQGFIVIDDAACEEATLSCCGLGLELEDAAEVCPNEDYQIEPEILNAMGNVTIEWTADPPEAINYLSATDIESPVFNFPFSGNEFDGLVITYTMLVEDDACEIEKDIEIEVLAYTPVNFSFLDLPYCEMDNEVSFPTISEEGISGTWTPASVDVSDYAGETVEIVFIANEGEVLCPVEFTYELEVEVFNEPTFNFPLLYCRSEQDIIEFPTESLEDIQGSWNIEEINLSDWSDGEINLLFTPDDLFCTIDVEFEIEITSGEPLQFLINSQYCRNDSIFILEDIDLNGIGGVWDNSRIDLSISGVFERTFTPTIDEKCYAPFVFSYEVLDQLDYSFDIHSPICKSDTVIVLDSMSLEGVLGAWNIQSFNPDTIVADSIVLFWNAVENQGNCNGSVELIFNFTTLEMPLFNLPDSLCKNDDTYGFDTLSLNGLSGAWTIEQFVPSDVQDDYIESIFIPVDTVCAEEVSFRINLYDLAVPEFDFASSICIFDIPYTLPSISTNGIEGSWSINPVEFIGNGTINSIFIPSDNCAEWLDNSWDIDFESDALFSIPEYLCVESSPYILPSQSDNGITGVWSHEQIDPALYSDGLAEIYFVPDAIFCADTVFRSLDIIELLPLDFTLVEPSGCNTNDGLIIFDFINSELEYSYNDGMSWIQDKELTGLTDGIYNILYRLIDRELCIDRLSITINSMNIPVLLNLNYMDQSSCLEENAWISIEVEGDNLQYSIDQGMTWQADGFFNGLSEGDYTIIVQELNSSDCKLEHMLTIGGPTFTSINEVNVMQISDCQMDDAEIEVIATGNNLEYSIYDNTWQSSNIFQSLSPGDYVLSVRSVDQTDCLDELMISIDEIISPSIDELITSPAGECDTDVGTVLVLATGNDLEYSIDNGANWTANPMFDMLPSGDYELIVREKQFVNCFEISEFNISLVEESLQNIELNIDSISMCDLRDGKIEVIGGNTPLEYSLDNGLFWQTDNVFTNLAVGEYDLLVQQIASNGCDTIIRFELIDPQCPCIELQTEFEIRPITCNELANGSIDLVELTTQVYELVWSNGEESNFIDDLDAGWYYVTISYENDCIWIDSVFMSEFDPINFGIIGLDSDCKGSNNGSLSIIDAIGGSGVYNYSINGEVYIDDNVFFNLSPKEYEVFVLDANDCLASNYYEIAIANVLDFKLDSIITIEEGESIFLNPLLIEGDIDSFVWKANNLILQNNSLFFEISPLKTTTYQLTVYYGPCVQYFNIIVEVKKGDSIYLGNVINPGSTGVNASLYLQSKSDSKIVVNEFIIYDRWGNMVFHKLNPKLNLPEDGWDGYFNNQRVNLGVFVYYIEYILDGEIKTIVNNITVIR